MKKIYSISRRNFIKSTLMSAGAFCIGSNTITTSFARTSTDKIIGANEDIRVAVIGIRSQGNGHIQTLRKIPGVRIVALCDVDSNVLNQRAEELAKHNIKVKKYTDMRALFDDPEIDAVSMATPNHWHSLGTIWACQAGKDVYVEKPVSHNVAEGRRMVEAARKYKRIVQAGTQCRSSKGLQEAVEWIKEGNLGAIKLARGLCYKRRNSIGKVYISQSIPKNIDYNLWCGPAAMSPLTRKNLHYDWHWVWNTGAGDLGNQGIHQMDIARWFLGETTLPQKVWSMGGRYGYIDDAETPNTQIIYLDYKRPLIFEVRGLPRAAGDNKMDSLYGASIGVIIECEGGRLVNPSYTSATAYSNDGKEIKKFNAGGNHHENWIKAIRSHKSSDLNGDILEGHISSALCHIGNISYRLGSLITPEKFKDTLQFNSALQEVSERLSKHLEANKIDLNKEKTYSGDLLELYEGEELFVGNSKANQLLTREYRYPFVVPPTII